jgi:hypothetical protein
METEPQREPLAEIPLLGGQLTLGIVRRPAKGNAAFVHDLLLFSSEKVLPSQLREGITQPEPVAAVRLDSPCVRVAARAASGSFADRAHRSSCSPNLDTCSGHATDGR